MFFFNVILLCLFCYAAKKKTREVSLVSKKIRDITDVLENICIIKKKLNLCSVLRKITLNTDFCS